MKARRSSSPFTRIIIQSETICITTAFLFLIGLVQVMISLAMRYVQRIHFNWYLYPEWSASTTIFSFIFGILYCGTRKTCNIAFICICLLISFMSSLTYLVLLMLDLFMAINNTGGSHSITTTTNFNDNKNKAAPSFLLSNNNNINRSNKLVDDSTTATTIWDLLPFAILILSLVQALLSLSGAVLTFIWSGCCQPFGLTKSSSNALFAKTNSISNSNAVRRLLNNNNSNNGNINQHIYQPSGALSTSPLLTMRRATLGRPTYCSDTMRSIHRMAPQSSSHYGTATMCRTEVNKNSDDPNDIYVARNIMRRAADEV